MTDQGNSYISRLADEMEEVQLDMGGELLGHAAGMFEDPKTNPLEFRFLSARLCEALRDARRVAESRGGRLAELSDDDAEPARRPTSDNGTTG
ncbi:hypothetical protein AB0B07_30315 [Streptomyces sioyaensis]|uniref:hypothetical protein n=1 Tax=Streptomyces sioyaensis TaxID=67364 RepID=UPI0033D23B76